MTDDELFQRNDRLADWIVRLRSAMSLMVDGHPLTAYRQVCRITDEMQAYALAPTAPTHPPLSDRAPLYKCPTCGSFSEIDYFIYSHVCETTGKRPSAQRIKQAEQIKAKYLADQEAAYDVAR